MQNEVFTKFTRWNLNWNILKLFPVERISKYVVTVNTLNESSVSFESSAVIQFFLLFLIDEKKFIFLSVILHFFQ
jgi:hypothetical protein